MRILYLDLDTLRPDHLGCYGYHRNTSPNIDRIAKAGVRFENYYCSDAPCLPSRTALMTGRFGIHTGVVGHGGTAADLRIEGPGRKFSARLGDSSLPSFLRAQGLYTTFIGGFAERHSSWNFYAGFREIHDTGKFGMESAGDVTPTALEWIERHGSDDNWYLHVNYWDPHTPYRVPRDFVNPFEQDPLPGWITPEILAEQARLPGAHTPLDLWGYEDPKGVGQDALRELHSMDDLRRLIDGYDCGIRYMDSHIGQLLAAFEQKGVLDDLAIIISADHGENLGELGIYSEHATADSITCRIPMIIRFPGCSAGRVDWGLHYHLDLAPTLADLLGKQAMSDWDGESFARVLLHGEQVGQKFLVLSQCAHVCQRSVRWDHWLYMRTYHDGYYLFPAEMLYDIDADPHLQIDLALSRPELCKEAIARLEIWFDRMMSSMPPGYISDPMRTVLMEGGPHHAKGYLPKYCQRLMDTGREEYVPMLKERHPDEFR